VRNGPVTARIVEPVPEPAPQHYDDVVVFDAAPAIRSPRDPVARLPRAAGGFAWQMPRRAQ
jgi:hypothetical protein